MKKINKLIIEMVEKKRISAEDADQLIKLINKQRKKDKQEKKNKQDKFGDKFEGAEILEELFQHIIRSEHGAENEKDKTENKDRTDNKSKNKSNTREESQQTEEEIMESFKKACDIAAGLTIELMNGLEDIIKERKN